MTKHLQKAINNHPEQGNISSISKTDAEIILCLVDILKKRGVKDLDTILSTYKLAEDDLVLEAFQEVRDTVKLDSEDVENIYQQAKEDGNDNFIIPFIEFEDLIIKPNTIIKINIQDSYSTKETCPIYEIVLNEDSENRLLAHNTVIKYYSRDVRNKSFKKLKNALKKIGVVYITVK